MQLSVDANKFHDHFEANNPHLAACPDCFTLGPKVHERVVEWRGSAFNDAYCKEGYTGPLCSVCSQEWYPYGTECWPCAAEGAYDGTLTMLGIFVGVFLCVAGCVGGIILKMKAKENKQVGSAKSNFLIEKKKKINILKALVKENKLKVFMLVVAFQVLDTTS